MILLLKNDDYTSNFMKEVIFLIFRLISSHPLCTIFVSLVNSMKFNI